MNLEALKSFQKKTQSGEGNKSFINAKTIGENPDGLTFRASRIVNDKLGGIPFMAVDRWWFGKQSIICPSTLDTVKGKGFIEQLIEDSIRKAQANDDDELAQRLADSDVVKKETTYWIAGWQLVVPDDETEEGLNYQMVDGCPKILQAKQSVKNALIDLYTSKVANKIKSSDKFADRIDGLNAVIGKSGKGVNTRYNVTMDAGCELSESDFENPIDVYNAIELSIPSKKYIKEFVRAFCLGEEMNADIKNAEKGRTDKLKLALKGIMHAEDGEDYEVAATAKPTQTVQKPKTKPASKPIDEDEDEDEPAPKPTKPANKVKRPTPEVDEDGDVIPTKPAKPAAGKTDVPGLKKPLPKVIGSLADDDFDDEDEDEPALKPSKAAKPASKQSKPAPKKADEEDDDFGFDDDDFEE